MIHLFFELVFCSSGKEGLSMKFFMELLSSLTIRDILAIAQLLTTSLDCILKIIELKRKNDLQSVCRIDARDPTSNMADSAGL